MKCPECSTENPSDSKYCKECAAALPSYEESQVSMTKTLETPKEELATGSLFAGRYQIIEELGKGGMGKVYKTHDTEIREKVALKLIKPEIAADKNTIERFQNELKFARKISHRNVCRMYDLNKEEGSYYITMEYVEGEDLKSTIRRIGQLPVGKSISIAKQICDGLAEAHRLGVVHRDLKPSNIMIDKEGSARIMDFGIARSLKEKGITGAGVMIGTPEYMSPEQVEGKELDQRSDIYSLGIILYEMVTARVPFEGDTPFTIGVKHKSEIPKDPKELNVQIPDDLSRVILKCLEIDKENRYQDAEELRSELTKIEKEIPSTEREISKRKPITSKEITVTFGLRKLFIPAIAIIVVASIAVIIWRLSPQKEAVLSPKIENSIAIISFKNQTGDKAYDYLQEAIPNLLITNLENVGYFYVATRERMHDILKQMGKGEVEIIDRDLGFELCRREGIEAIVLGSFIKAGDMFATDVKVLDVETKKLLKSANTKGKSIDSILEKQIDDLSKEITQGIGIARQKIEAAQIRIAEATTTSIEAYNYFLKGRNASEKFYHEEARQHLEKAIELDPTFASSYLYLYRSLRFLGNTEAANEALEKAKAFSEKATHKERLYIEATYAARIEKKPEERFRIYKEMAEKYPKEKRVHHFLGLTYRRKKLYDESIEEFGEALELDPNYGPAMNDLAYTYVYKGNYEKAIEYFQKYASVSPGDANPYDSLAELYFRMGMLDKSIEKYKEALEIKPDFYFVSTSIGYIYALKENYSEAMKWIEKYIVTATYQGWKAEGYLYKGFFNYWLGSLEQSLDDLRLAADLAESVGNEFWRAFADWMKGWIYYDLREFSLSREHFKSWFDFIKEYEPAYLSRNKAYHNFYLGLLDLKQGRIDSAKSRVVEMESLLSEKDLDQKDRIRFRYGLLRGEILLAEDSLDKAIAVCKKESPLEIRSMYTGNVLFYNTPFQKDLLARAYHQKGELDKAIAEYERLTTFDPESKYRRLIHPKYHYKLAKLYEEKNWMGKAIEQYGKFLEIWKDADPGITEVEDARKRLIKLKSY